VAEGDWTGDDADEHPCSAATMLRNAVEMINPFAVT
jgi:hypothetical protein